MSEKTEQNKAPFIEVLDPISPLKSDKKSVFVLEGDKSPLVVRHNKLIESRHKMTMAERRFVLWNIAQVNRDDTSFKPFEIGVRDYFDMVGLKQTSNPYEVVKNMHDRLTQRNIGIEYTDKYGKAAFAYYPWFSELRYDNGRISSLLNLKLVPFLLQLKEQFTTIALEQALILDGFYTGRVYDLLVQYKTIGSRKLTAEFLRDRFQITDKYKQFRDLRLYVVDPALKEINEKTDLHIYYDLIKEGRRFVGFDFKISESKPTVTLANNREEQDEDTKRLFKRLVRLGIQQDTARNLIAKYSDDRILWHISQYEKKRKAAKKSQQEMPKAGWLIEGIKRDYRVQQHTLFDIDRSKSKNNSSKQAQKQPQKVAKSRRALREELEHLDNTRMKLEKEKRIADLTVINALYKKLPEAEKFRIETDFIQSLEEEFQKEDFAVKRWKSLVCTGEMRRFWYQYNPTMFIDIADIALEQGHDWRALLKAITQIKKQTDL